MSLSDFPYRIVLNVKKNGDDSHYHYFYWLFQCVGFGGISKTGVIEALKIWYVENDALDESVEKWTVKIDRKWNTIKMKFYFKEKKDAAMFKMIWGGMEE